MQILPTEMDLENSIMLCSLIPAPAFPSSFRGGSHSAGDRYRTGRGGHEVPTRPKSFKISTFKNILRKKGTKLLYILLIIRFRSAMKSRA